MPKSYVYLAYGGPDQQRLVELERPLAGSEQLLVEVHAAGVNPADWKYRENQRNQPPREGPTPMGFEAAGVVVDLGLGCPGFEIGEAVFGFVSASGAFSEYCLLDPTYSAAMPPGLSFADAATLPVAAATAYDAVRELALAPGSTLLVTGCGGGIGVIAAQLAREQGVHVIGTASAAKRALVTSLGALHVDYGLDGVVERLRALAPNGYDALLDTVGGAALEGFEALHIAGERIVAVGDAGAAERLGGRRVRRDRRGGVLAELAALVAEGRLDPHVTHRFPLERCGEALALVEGGHATGKVVIEVLAD